MKLNSLFLQHKWVQSILGGLFCALFSLILWNAGLMDMWEGKTWDWRESLMAKPSSATDDICLILVDQTSLDWMSQNNGLNWPWPREIYSVVIDFCKRVQAKAVAFDVLFTEPSSYGVEDDRTFAKSVRDYGNVASAAFLKKLSNTTPAQFEWIENRPFSPITLNGLKSWTETPAGKACLFTKAAMPIAELASTSSIICNVQQEPDPDAIYRRVRMVSIFGNYIVPCLGLGIYFADFDSQIVGNIKQESAIGSGVLSIDNRTIPLDKKGEAILRYRGQSGTHKIYSAASIIQSEIEFRNRGAAESKETTIDKSAFRDKYVFFSFSAPGLFDLRSSPVDSVYPGVEIQATILDNFLVGDFISDTPEYVVIVWVIFWSILCAVCIASVKGTLPLIFTGGAAVVLPASICIAAYVVGVWLPLVVQELTAVFAVIFSLGLNYVHEGRQRRFIKNAFSQYLSPVFIEQLIQHPEKLKLGGERKELSIFFSDLQGFTSISEKLSPEELTSLLNNYLSVMTEIIHEEGGTVDKYEGDAIIAFWNAPLDVPNHGVYAVRAALRCQNKLALMRPEMKKVVDSDMRMRIGLNTGVVVVGNMGSYSRFDYTMLGDSVNLAARLEGANKQFGTYTMISAATRNAITNRDQKSEVVDNGLTSASRNNNINIQMKEEFAFRELARLAVMGKKEAVTVFEPMSPDDFQANQYIYNTFDKGLQFFYKGEFQSAIEIFSLISDRDHPASSYIKKCRELLLSGVDATTGWNGVWTMTSK
ncbi:MAG: adenylate/guanylate cyclase domain-containing protein [Desulfamplus sp.]|nr:adenylate/guanylate cyclase domain-containing protein [Desulfamplus sp.]